MRVLNVYIRHATGVLRLPIRVYESEKDLELTSIKRVTTPYKGL